MDQNSQHKQNLEVQIKEAYGKLVYTYTTHNKEVDRIKKKNTIIKYIQIILSAISTGGFIGSVFADNGAPYKIIAGLVSTFLLAINIFFKDFDLKEEIVSHQNISNELWLIREQYISLLTDLPILNNQQIMGKRDYLQEKTSEIYKIAPKTSSKSYSTAQKALKKEEEQFFAEKELNQMLPKHLRE